MHDFFLIALACVTGQDARDLTDRFESPEGCEVSLWAESPQLYNPTAIDVDPQGRVWVAEAVNYRRWGGRNPGIDHSDGDRIVILEDSDGDGRFEKRTDFARGLTFPNGILPWKKGFLVTDAPDLLYLEDSDDDGVADKREVVLTGFFTNSSSEQLRVASPVLGPDGWIT